ncbi:MAG: hypothetical protein JXQ97_04475 [Natronospirillum sp.]
MSQIRALRHSSITSFDFKEDLQLHRPGMRLPQQGGGHYLVPLTASQPTSWQARAAGDPLPELADVPNLLMPVRLLRLKADGSTQPLRAACWLYVFQNGYLWREIRLPYGHMPLQQDVNLSLHAGKDQRPAQCLGGENLVLPYRINGENPEYRLAFSEVQWSWQQIQAVGGIHPEDPRNANGEDLQTATTLSALEQRACVLPLTDEDINDCRVQVLSGPSQPDVAAEPQVDVETLTLPHLLIVDTLQDARELKAQQDELIALQNAGQQSQQTGQLGLARMIQDLTADGGPMDLVKHLAENRYDQQLLDTWDSVSDQLPERMEAAEQALLAYLQQDDFTLAISDYMQSDDLLSNELGLSLFSQFIQHLVMPDSLAWLCTVLGDEQADQHPVYAPARGVNEALNLQLVHRTNLTIPLPDQEDERLRGINWADRLQLLSLLPTTLNGIIGKYTELATTQDAANLSRVLNNVSQRFERFTQIATQIESAPMRVWMPPANLKPHKGYRYLNSTFTETLHRLGSLQVLQLRPTEQSVDSFMRRLNTHPGVQGALTPTLGILLGVNGIFAINKAMKEQSIENSLAATSTTVSFLVLVMESLQKWVPKPIELQLNSTIQVSGRQRNFIVESGRLHRLVHGGTFPIVLRALVIGEAILGVALGIWQAVRGVRTGNAGVAVAGGLLAFAGLLMLATHIAVMKGLLVVMALTPFTAALLALGLIALSIILAIRSEHTVLEQIVRHGWFGSHPYTRGVSGLQPPTGENPSTIQQNLLHHLQSSPPDGQQEDPFIWPDAEPELTGELQAFTRQLFHFSAQIKVYSLTEPSMVATDHPAPRQPTNRIVELYVRLGAFAPIDTVLDGELTLIGHKYPLSRCYVVEGRSHASPDGISPPQELRILLEVHESMARSRISAQAWLDPDGSGQVQVPERPVTCRWNRTVQPMNIHEWQRLKQLAVQKPLGAHDDMVMVDQGLHCRMVPREEALFRPFLSLGAH